MKSAVVLTNLDPGQYAIILFHDENGNGKLDRNALGVPTEPYGFSNNVRGFLGPQPSKKQSCRSTQTTKLFALS
jgi:uncharacterized protein (DUF2141 family)